LASPEIDNLRLAFSCDHDIGRLDVAVDNPRFVSLCQATADLDGDVDRLVDLNQSRVRSSS